MTLEAFIIEKVNSQEKIISELQDLIYKKDVEIAKKNMDLEMIVRHTEFDESSRSYDITIRNCDSSYDYKRMGKIFDKYNKKYIESEWLDD